MDCARVFHVHNDVLRIPATLYISNRFYFAYYISGLVVISSLFIIPETILAQVTDNLTALNNQTKNQSESDSLKWTDLVGLIAATGAISAVGTGFFDRHIMYKQLEKQQSNTLIQEQDERQRKFIKQKVGLYSEFIFYIERMIENPQFGQPPQSGNPTPITPESPHKIKRTTSDIDLLLTNRLYLVKPNEFKLWLKFRNLDDELSGRDDNKRREAIETIYELRNDLVRNYNNSLIIEYSNKMDSPIDPIEPENRPPNYR